MRLRIIGRHDSMLLAGLTFALLVIFQRSIQVGLSIAQELEHTYGVALIPALLILTVMFVFHVNATRREVKAEATAAANEAQILRARTQELENLMLFGQSLARSLSIEALRETVWRHLPALAGGADVWVLLQGEHGWERMTDVSGSRWPLGDLERIADSVTAQPPARLEHMDGVEANGHVCFVMLIGTRPIGIVGVENQEHSVDTRRKLSAAAALLSVAVRNAQLFAEVRDHGLKDGLTGCYNREHSLEILGSELSRSQRSGSPLSLVLFDVDNFKHVNDKFGHLSGDRVLAAVGQRVRQVLRRSDVRCRYGGDEFLIVLPETGDAGAARVAEWLRTEIEQIDIAGSGERIPISISAGVTTLVGGGATPEALIERADKALYQAKAAGRNCVRTVPGLVRPAPVTQMPASLALVQR